MYRQTYLEVDCNKLKNNIIDIRKNYNDYKYYFGVVKANAYGHGAYIINSLIDGGINYLAVSSLEEAINVRKYNNEIPVLILEPIRVEFINKCIENNFTITVSSVEYFKQLSTCILNNELKFHIKVDSGMSRLGIQSNSELNKIFEMQKQCKNLFLEGIYTHFATSGVFDKHWDNQLEKFKTILSDTDLSKIPIIHMNRSQTLVNHEKIPFCNGTRLGIMMYGIDYKQKTNYSGLRGFLRKFKQNYIIKKQKISPTISTNNLNINTAIKLYSEVIEIRTIDANDFVGYGALFIANKKAKIATIPIGYADGISKKCKQVCINNKLYNIVGEICMDMIMVEVDDSVNIHDKVLLFGNELLPLKKVCNQTGLSSYNVFTSIMPRVPRVYINNNEKIEISYLN